MALGGEISPVDAPSIGWFDVDTQAPTCSPAGPGCTSTSSASRSPGVGGRRPVGGRRGRLRERPHLGTQFHPEVTPPIVDDWLRSEAAVVTRLGVDPDAVRAQSEAHAATVVERAFALFDGWLARRRRPALAVHRRRGKVERTDRLASISTRKRGTSSGVEYAYGRPS